MKTDFLIIGAGYSGSILAERIATQLNKKVLIVERRNHIAGNAYDYYDRNGVLVHKYGPHIFHTTAKKVWDYLSKFTKWNNYIHHVRAVVEGKEVPVPFNLNSISMLFPPNYAAKLENILISQFGYGVKIPILNLLKHENPELKFLADYIYKNVFFGYTVKQWGMKPDELESSVTARVPVYISRDDRYFQDPYQGIPESGYTKMFENILNHPNIHLLLNTDYKEVINDIDYKYLISTAPIDEFYDCCYGRLPYRSLDFELKSIDTEHFQSGSQINFPNSYDYTRITEFKHFHKQTTKRTTVAYEFPEEYNHEINEPYYPIPKDENHQLFNKYKELAEKESKNIFHTGRLADYKYYNMDHTALVALRLFENKISKLYE